MPLEIRGLLGRRANAQHGSASGDVMNSQTTRLPDRVYRTLLGTEQRLKNDPTKYNIGEIPLEAASQADFSAYEGNDLPLFDQAQRTGTLEAGKPYVARGIITVNDESEAVLRTASGEIRLGKIGAHAQRMFLLDLKGYEMVLPLIIDEINDAEVKGKPGEKAAYLIPNPDLLTRRRLKKIDGRADFEGEVRTIGQEDTGTMTIQTKPGRNWFGRKRANIFFDRGKPRYDQGTEIRPTSGEPVAPNDRVRVATEFLEGKPFLTNVSLLDFSPKHAEEYTRQRQTIEHGFTLFETLLTSDEFQTVTAPNGKAFDVSEPQKRGAVMRYLFAELRKRQHIFTPAQHQRLWEFVASMPEDQRPVMFNNFDAGSKPDPRREQLDEYFRQQDPKTSLPKLAESMTPTQLLYEMAIIAATHDYPPSLDVMIGIIRDFQGQFPEDASSMLLQSVLVYREEQLRAGENAYPAIFSLSEALPYLKEKDVPYQADWLVHLIQAGGLLFNGNPDEWKGSAELQYFLRQCIAGLGSAVYTDENYSGINYQALFMLVPYYADHLQYWTEHLPYGLGQEASVGQLLRDLDLLEAFEESKLLHQVEDGIRSL